MRISSKQVTTGAKAGLLLSLATVAVLAIAANQPATTGQKLAASGSQPVAAALTAEPVTRLMIRYKTGVKLAGQGGATPATEKLEAAMQVARTANLSGETRLQYLKSVSPSLHVATLEQALSSTDAEALMQRLRADASVADVAIDHRMTSHAVATDPNYVSGVQWHLQDSSAVPGGLNVNQAWASSTGSGVVVAVLDSGYRPHVDLVDNVLPGYDFISADSSGSAAATAGQPYWTAADGTGRDGDAQDPGSWVTQSDVNQNFCDTTTDSTWHGTHVAGIVASPNNGLGGLGVAFGARVLPVRVLGRCGGYTSDILAGAQWAVGMPVPGVLPTANPAKILNLSLGVTGVACDSITQGVVNEIRARDISVVASTGNQGSTSITLPANCAGVIAVTAHTREADSSSYANVGPGTRISAAGGGDNTVLTPLPATFRGIVSTWNTGTTVPAADGYASYQGTSMATPQVVGVLALLASLRPDLSMAELENLVLGSARAFPAGGYCATNPDRLPAGFCGSGLLDAQAAVAALQVYTGAAAGGNGGGGGGCTAAPDGRADGGLVLIVLAAGSLMGLRRRRSR